MGDPGGTSRCFGNLRRFLRREVGRNHASASRGRLEEQTLTSARARHICFPWPQNPCAVSARQANLCTFCTDFTLRDANQGTHAR